jgi:hypothetical protein
MSENKRCVVLPFPGFYETQLSNHLVDDETGEERATAKEVTQAYFRGLKNELAHWLGIDVDFDRCLSPREYNFETDRLFGWLTEEAAKLLFAMSEDENHATLREEVKKKCTDRPGFWSYYPSDLADWLDNPVEEWDHNELGILLGACLLMAGTSEQEVMDEATEYTICNS